MSKVTSRNSVLGKFQISYGLFNGRFCFYIPPANKKNLKKLLFFCLQQIFFVETYPSWASALPFRSSN
jgi:hypothetical protein